MEPRPTPALFSTELAAIGESPERYVRIAVTKNTKGFSYETTVSLRWTSNLTEGAEELQSLLQLSDGLAREEIANREALDREAA